MSYHTLDFILLVVKNHLHLVQNFAKILSELAFIRYKADSSLGLTLLLLDKVNLSGDLGLFALRAFFIHLFKDILRALLINSDL